MADSFGLGKAFLEELAGKLPADLQGRITDVLSSPEAKAALEHVGSRVSPIDEERQRLHALKNTLDTREQNLTRWHGELKGWATTKETEYTDRERKIAEREAGGGGGGNNGNNGQPPVRPEGTPGSMTKDEVVKTVGEVLRPLEGGVLQYVGDATNFSAFHLKHFNEPLDVHQITRHEKIGELGFRGVYELLHKEKLDKMTADAKAAERAALKEELRKEIIGERPTEMPYPVGEGSPLDALSLDPAARPKGDPVAAARMYEGLVGASGGR